MMDRVQLDKLKSDTGRIARERVCEQLETLDHPLAQLYREIFNDSRTYDEVSKWRLNNPKTAQELANFLNNLEDQIKSEVRAELMKEYGFTE
jgi:hypothetical protein